MTIDLTQDEIRELLAGLPADHAAVIKLTALARESSTLRVLAEIGPAPGQCEDILKRMANWPKCDDVVYPSEADARQAVPRAFQDVCTEWGRAGHISKEYCLADGRVVRKSGVWWDVPEPGGSVSAFYFAD